MRSDNPFRQKILFSWRQQSVKWIHTITLKRLTTTKMSSKTLYRLRWNKQILIQGLPQMSNRATLTVADGKPQAVYFPRAKKISSRDLKLLSTLRKVLRLEVRATSELHRRLEGSALATAWTIRVISKSLLAEFHKIGKWAILRASKLWMILIGLNSAALRSRTVIQRTTSIPI